MSRIRNKEYETVHHLTSRIAHKVYFLKEEERNDFLSLVLRVSAFAGIELFGWCIMHNHFHLDVYLPTPPLLTDDEVLARARLLKEHAVRALSDTDEPTGYVRKVGAEGQTPDANFQAIGSAAKTGAEGQTSDANFDRRMQARAEVVKSLRRRMYDIGEYMKMIKQWFTEDYNDRNGHKGTLWEAPYGDHVLSLPEDLDGYTDIRDILAYIHLNPIRAAITDQFDGYEWSSYAAFRKGDPDAVSAMHRVYPGLDDEEIVRRHEDRMIRLLEDWKRKRAQEIARKRAEGYELPSDHLTDECLIAQEAAHAAEVQKELERLHAERNLAEGAKARREIICREIECTLLLHPEFTARDVAAVIDAPARSVQRYMSDLRKNAKAA